MAGVTTMVSREEYLRTSYEPDCDWVNGEIKERNVGEVPHALVQKWLAMFFGNQEELWKIVALTEARVQTSDTNYRIPDLCLMPEAWRYEVIVRTPPLLCVEILSWDDRMTEMYEKVDDYLGMGVRAVWVIDPRRRKVLCTDPRGALIVVAEELTVEGTDIRVAAKDLFEQLNRLESVN